MHRLKTSIASILVLIASTAFCQICDLEELDTIAAPGSPGTTVVKGPYAYVAAGTGGLVRINVAQPEAMDLVDFTITAGEANALVFEYFRNLLVVADGSAGVATYAIGADGVLEIVAGEDLGAVAVSITGTSGRFFVGTESGLLVSLGLDADDKPVVRDTLDLGGQILALEDATGRVYCALGSAAEIAIVDTSDVNDLQLVGTVSLPGAVRSIALMNSRLLCGVDGVGLMSFIISGDSLQQGAQLEMQSAPTDVFAWDGRVYMASPGFGITLADASLGDRLISLSELELDGAAGISLSGTNLFVGRQDQGFSSVDVSACVDPGGSRTSYFIPASARAVGAENTYWVTDVAVANFSSGVATFNIAYLAKDADNSNPLQTTMAIGSGQQLILADVFDLVFGLESGNGALRIIASDEDVKITSRTYNAAGAAGTYGQFIPALTSADAIVPGVDAVLIQLQQNAAFRTNIGVVNLTDKATETEIHLYDGDGQHLGFLSSAKTKLEAFEMIQIGRVFEQIGAGRVDSGYAVVRTTTAGARVIPYASVIDQGSGDPIYLPAQKLSIEFRR